MDDPAKKPFLVGCQHMVDMFVASPEDGGWYLFKFTTDPRGVQPAPPPPEART